MSEVDDQIAARAPRWRGSPAIRATARAGRARAARAAQAIGRKRLTRIAVADAAILVAAVVVGLDRAARHVRRAGGDALLVAATLGDRAGARGRRPPPERSCARSTSRRCPRRPSAGWRRSAPPCPRPRARWSTGSACGWRRCRRSSPRSTTSTEPRSEVRRLVGEQLPAFVNDYAARARRRCAAPPRNGRTPDARAGRRAEADRAARSAR